MHTETCVLPLNAERQRKNTSKQKFFMSVDKIIASHCHVLLNESQLFSPFFSVNLGYSSVPDKRHHTFLSAETAYLEKLKGVVDLRVFCQPLYRIVKIEK